MEANKFTRKSAKNELDEKIKVWGNAAPLVNLSRPLYAIDVIALEQAIIVTSGSILLKEDRESSGLNIPRENEHFEVTSDEDAESTSDSFWFKLFRYNSMSKFFSAIKLFFKKTSETLKFDHF